MLLMILSTAGSDIIAYRVALRSLFFESGAGVGADERSYAFTGLSPATTYE